MGNSIAQIKTELETLPEASQSKVLAYIEYLKYKNLLQQTSEKVLELGGIEKEPEDNGAYAIGEALFSEEATLEKLQDKNALVQQINEALSRLKTGDPGVFSEEMLQRIRQWQKK
ncbi:MAG: hypothetical protein ACKV1O_17005 [Saprospiraceae bacterium]